jgi:hypothetical protein
MGIWSQASEMAAKTPPERNRYVDFLRAASIMVVIVGHWLMATAYYADGNLVSGHLLKTQTQMQWVTWLFQVMPIFFFVGGYSNAVSLESASKKNQPYGEWLAARLNRLVAPLLVLIIGWAALALIMDYMGVREPVIQWASQASLIPTWFLAIYIVVVILAPLTYAFWRRLGFLSFFMFVAGAVLVDIAFFVGDMKWLGWSNYFFVWLAVHHLGYAWRDGRIGTPVQMLLVSAVGLLGLALGYFKGPYPLAMVGSPDEGLSNTLPPKIMLIALGLFQFGFLLAIEKPMRQLLSRLWLWTSTVLISSMIMTVYLWHITVMVVVVGILFLLDGFGLGIDPGSTTWWYTRPVWVGVLLVLLLPAALLLSRFERGGRTSGKAPPAAERQVVGAMMLCLGIALLAMHGYGGGPFEHMDKMSFALVVVGSGVSGLLPGFKS